MDEAEKHVYAGTMKKTGSYQGYKLRQYWVRMTYVSACIHRNSDVTVSILIMEFAINWSIITVRFFLHCSTSSLTSPEVNRDISKRVHPPALMPFLREIAEFARHNHEEVLHPILRFDLRFLTVQHIQLHVNS